MYLNELRSMFRVRQGTKLALRAVENRFGSQFAVSDEDDGYHLVASGRLFWHDEGHPGRSFPATCTIVMPHRRLLLGDSSRWLFEDLCREQSDTTPAWQEVADAIATRAFGDKSWGGQYGVIPGYLTYDGECEVTFCVNVQRLEAVCFYTRDNIAGFASRENYNMFQHRKDINLVLIPVASVLQMLAR